MRLPAYRHSLLLAAAAGALGSVTPAVAQTADSYTYAQPAPHDAVVYRSDLVVQGELAEDRFDERADAVPELPMPPVPPVPPMAPMSGPSAPVYHTYAMPAAYPDRYPPQGYAQHMAADFDRDGWLADCRHRIRGIDRRDRGGVIGGLLGAIAGGVIGNRAWDRHRTAGTLLGAGVGGLAGLAIGSAVDAAGRHHDDECAFYLDQYMSSYPGPQAHPGYAYGYPAYGYAGYTLVPVLIAVPQRQVIRETVTEEWVEEPVRRRSLPARRHHSATPRTKYIKGN
jgi:hypothetical protein